MLPGKQGDAHRLTGRESFQPTLSALLADVRALRRELEQTVARHAASGRADARQQRARLLDQWIRQSSGHRQLVCFACAAEYGVLEREHLELGRRSMAETEDRALRALYWATVHRWRREPAARRQRSDIAAPEPRPVSLVSPGLCGPCRELGRDARRYAPHARLISDEQACEQKAHAGSVSWYCCATCSTPWVRRAPPSELFAAWSIVRADGMSASMPGGFASWSERSSTLVPQY